MKTTKELWEELEEIKLDEKYSSQEEIHKASQILQAIAEIMGEEKTRLEEIRKSIREENISYGEIAELRELASLIAVGDTELLEWAGALENTSCPKCSSPLYDEIDEDLKKEYPYVCIYCDENFYSIETNITN